MINLYNQKWIRWQRIYMGEGREPYGFCFWPFIFWRDGETEISPRQRRHEEYHYAHQQRLWVIPYHIGYMFLWLKHGYWNHPWEIAARKAESDTTQ